MRKINFENVSDARLIKAWRLATKRLGRYQTFSATVWHYIVVVELDKRGI